MTEIVNKDQDYKPGPCCYCGREITTLYCTIVTLSGTSSAHPECLRRTFADAMRSKEDGLDDEFKQILTDNFWNLHAR